MSTTLFELAKYYNSDNNDDIIIESIYNKLCGKETTLLESISDQYTENYKILIESVDVITTAEKEIKDAEKDKDNDKEETKIGVINKCVKAIKNVWDWWYKVDPNKKFKTLHLILKILIKALEIYILVVSPGKAVIAKNIEARLPNNFGYKGNSKILTAIASKSAIAVTLTRTIYSQILSFLSKINSYNEFKANIKDIDKSIKEYDEAIDKINDLLEKAGDPQIKMNLEKTKSDLEKSLAMLIKIKEKNAKKINKNK